MQFDTSDNRQYIAERIVKNSNKIVIPLKLKNRPPSQAVVFCEGLFNQASFLLFCQIMAWLYTQVTINEELHTLQQTPRIVIVQLTFTDASRAPVVRPDIIKLIRTKTNGSYSKINEQSVIFSIAEMFVTYNKEVTRQLRRLLT